MRNKLEKVKFRGRVFSWVVVYGLGDLVGVGDEVGRGFKDGLLYRDKRDFEVIE